MHGFESVSHVPQSLWCTVMLESIVLIITVAGVCRVCSSADSQADANMLVMCVCACVRWNPVGGSMAA